MSRHSLRLDPDRELVFGWDEAKDLTILGATTTPIPLPGTYWAQLWDRKHDPDFRRGSPVWALGSLGGVIAQEPFAANYGPHPIRTLSQFIELLQAWGIGPNVRAEVERILTRREVGGD